MISKLTLHLAALAMAATLAWSCNSGEDIYPDLPPAGPQIWFDAAGRTYVVKPGQEAVIIPIVKHGVNGIEDDPAYSYKYKWVIDGQTISFEKVFRHTFTQAGDVYVTLHVETEAGEASEEALVKVGDLAPPVISIALPPDGLTIALGGEYTFAPDVQNGEEAVYTWTLDGQIVGGEKDYVFTASELGSHTLSLHAANGDGEDTATVSVTVVDELPLRIVVPAGSSFDDPSKVHVTLDRKVYLQVIVLNASDPAYSWSVDGVEQAGADRLTFSFTPTQKRTYEIEFTVTDDTGGTRALSHNVTLMGARSLSHTFSVECFGEESALLRPITGNKLWNKVFEYTPAPGQFINEPISGYEGVTTPAAACAYAEERLSESQPVSLGGFGGYIIVGFDHSIDNKGGREGYDFSIAGNHFQGGSEPGIVWVSQDVNGDGKPNDVWYELRGSETGESGTIQGYAVTYYRPAGPKMDVQWMDNRGNTGALDYSLIAPFHRQDYYYPLWVDGSSYTLYGTRLEHRITQDPQTGLWVSGEFDWGYADNLGSDTLDSDPGGQANPMKTYFRISQAMNPDLSPANLMFIDFVKVQTALHFQAGWLGENSTEVLGFEDENI